MKSITEEQILKLVEAGIQAPSADNGQPWKFKILEDGFELWFDHSNMGLFFDVQQVATVMSCGALFENVSMLANAYGWAAEIEFCSDRADKFARIVFKSNNELQRDAEGVLKAIFNRHTDRNLFQFNKPIPEALLNELADIVHAERDFRWHVYQSPQDKKAIIRTITATDTIRFIHEKIHNDFYHVLRFGHAAERTRDGLAAKTLGIESFLVPVLRMLKPWGLTKILNYIGLHHVMAFRGTWLPMKSASEIVSIVYSGPVDYFKAGRIMERVWVQANKAGLSVQPLGALPLFLARLHLTQGEGFSSQELKSVLTIEERFAAITPVFSKDNDQLVMLFRLGYSNRRATTAYRREMESFIL